MASDPQFDRIQRHLEGCLLESGVFERGVEGAQLFDVEIVKKYSATWLLMAAGISAAESNEFVQPHRRDRATVPMQIVPKGQLSLLLLVRPYSASETRNRGKFVTEFSLDVGEIELSQGSYFRVDNIESPAIRHPYRGWDSQPSALASVHRELAEIDELIHVSRASGVTVGGRSDPVRGRRRTRGKRQEGGSRIVSPRIMSWKV